MEISEVFLLIHLRDPVVDLGIFHQYFLVLDLSVLSMKSRHRSLAVLSLDLDLFSSILTVGL